MKRQSEAPPQLEAPEVQVVVVATYSDNVVLSVQGRTFRLCAGETLTATRAWVMAIMT